MTDVMNYRNRKLFSSSIRRAIRWEFWPIPVFYAPIIIYLIYLTIKHRGITALSSNPGLPMSGLIGEKKANTLQQLQIVESPYVARFSLIENDLPLAQKLLSALGFMQDYELNYPVVLKPDFGQRGLGVAVIRGNSAMQDYLQRATGNVLIQEHIMGEEFGVFYVRYPEQAQGEIFSITEKRFPELVGDGVTSLETLILENDRTHYMARYLLELHQDKLAWVPTNGEVFKTVEIGSHCRGSLFLDGNHHRTDALAKRFDEISGHIEGFYFGRYDVRVPDVKSLQAGENIKVLEVNGLTSESTNIYDPKHSVLDAYRILFKQWRVAFVIGQQNIQRNQLRVSIKELYQHLCATYR